MVGPKGRTETLTAKVTPDTVVRVKETAARLRMDVSAFLNRAIQHELDDKPIDAAEAMLKLYMQDRQWQLTGQKLDYENWTALCNKVKRDLAAEEG